MGGDFQCQMTCPAFYHLPDWCTSEPWNCHCMLMSEMQEWMKLGERREGTLCLISCVFWLCWCLGHLCFALGSSENTYYLDKCMKESDDYAQLPPPCTVRVAAAEYLAWLGCWQTICCHALVCFRLLPSPKPRSWALLPIYSAPPYLTTSTNVC